MPGTSPGMTLLSRLTRSSTTCNGEGRIMIDRARGANKSTDQLGILDTRRALHARGNIGAAGARYGTGVLLGFGC